MGRDASEQRLDVIREADLAHRLALDWGLLPCTHSWWTDPFLLFNFEQIRWNHHIFRDSLLKFPLFLGLQVLCKVVHQICFSSLSQDLFQEFLVLNHELLDLHLTQDLMTEHAFIGFFTDTCPVQVFTGELVRLVRVVAAVSSVAVVCQEKLAELLCQVNRFLRLPLVHLLSLHLLIVLPIIEAESTTELLHRHLLVKLIPVAGRETLLVSERLLEIFRSTHLLRHLPLYVWSSSAGLLIVEEFTLWISLELLTVLILIELFVGFALIGLPLHLLLLLLDRGLLGESARVGGEVIRRRAPALECFTFELHCLFDDFLSRFIA